MRRSACEGMPVDMLYVHDLESLAGPATYTFASIRSINTSLNRSGVVRLAVSEQDIASRRLVAVLRVYTTSIEGTHNCRVAGSVRDGVEIHKVNPASAMVPRGIRPARYRDTAG